MHLLRPALLCALLLSLGTAPVHAQSPGDRDLIRERQQRLLEEQSRRLDALKQLPGGEADKKDPSQPGQGGCVNVQTIRLQGTEHLPEEQQRTLVAPFEGQCLDNARLNDLLGTLTKHYIARGLITSRAYLAPQDLSAGELTVLMIEGKLDGFETEGRPSQREIWMTHPGQTGELLNLRALEQMVDQLGRLPSRAVTLDILPVPDAPGHSRIRVQAEDQKPWRIGLRGNNLGDKATGRHQTSAFAVLDSPLGLADQISLSAGRDVNGGHGKHSDNQSIHYSLPFGWWTLSAGHNRSWYESRNDSAGFTFNTSGRSEVTHLRLDRLLHRDATSKTGAALSLSHLYANNYFENVLLDISSYRLSETDLSVNHGRRIGNTFLNLDIGWQRGIGAWDAQGHGHSPSGQPDARYNKYTLTLSALHPFSIKDEQFSLESLAWGQHSEDTLFSPQRVGLGGLGSVRGFKDQTLYGNSGGYWRNQLRWRKPVTWVALKPVISDFSVALGYDLGAIARNHQQGDDHARLTAHALEFTAQGTYGAASITIARALERPAGTKREHPVYFNVNLSY
jgi:hemolysin activation/secretion protein